MPVQVFSGIAPPQALLDHMASRPTPPPRPTSQSPYMASNLRPANTPIGPAAPSRPPTQYAPSDHIEPTAADIPDVAPPSYEDAMADELAPIDGPRRDYHQTPSRPPNLDGKGSGNDDRLFPESGA